MMKRAHTRTRRSTLALLCGIGALAATAARADLYPSRPISVIVPYAAGSGSDVIARIVLERMTDGLGQRFIVENRPAAGGNVGTAAAAKADPDGYTLLLSATGPLAINKTLVQKLGYDPESDFTPISMVAKMPTMFAVSGRLPVASVAEFIALARSKPGALNYASPGLGSGTHLAGAYFANAAGLSMTHVPYKVTPQIVTDLINGDIALSFLVLSNVAALLPSGQVKVLAVGSRERMPALPQTPTMDEAGVKGYEATVWFALLGPKGMPEAIVQRLNRAVGDALRDRTIVQRFTELGAVPIHTTPEGLQAFLSSEIVKWREAIQHAGLTSAPGP